MKNRLVVLLAVWLLAGSAVAAEVPAIRWEAFALPEGVQSLEAQLGRMTVPLIRSRPDGASAEIAFVRVRSSAKPTGAPIIFLPGGPGGSGISVARQAQSIASFGKLAELGDLILLDPRGVGLS